MNDPRNLLRASVAINLVLAVALGVLVLGSTVPSATGGYTLVVSKGLEMRMSSDEAVKVAQGVLESMSRGAATMGLDASKPERIISVIGATGVDVGDFEPRAAGAIAFDSKIWIVRAEGPFLQNRGLGPPHLFSSGYIIVEDSTGIVLAMGMP